MAAVIGRTELGVKEIGKTVTIPNDPRARLMYYLHCMCGVLDLSNQGNISKLRSYGQYYLLTEPEIDALVSLCFLLSPDELNGKVIFQDDSMCGNSSNKFFEISAVRHNLIFTESVLIGGQVTNVTKIMAYKQQWMVTNWIAPMQHFTPRLARIATSGAAPAPQRPALTYNTGATTTGTPSYRSSNSSSSDCCCTIL